MGDFKFEQVKKEKKPIFNIPIVIWTIFAFCALVFFIPNFFFSIDEYQLFIAYYAFIPEFFGQYTDQLFYTPLSHSFMHVGVMHLIFNMMWLVVFGSPLANRIGVLRFLLFWCVCAILAIFLYYIFNQGSRIPVLGASGAISGIMGGAARYGFRRVNAHDPRQRPEFAGPILSIARSLKSHNVIIFVGTWLVLNVIIGVVSGVGLVSAGGSVAWQAHIGGLAAGFFLAGFFDRRARNL